VLVLKLRDKQMMLQKGVIKYILGLWRKETEICLIFLFFYVKRRPPSFTVVNALSAAALSAVVRPLPGFVFRCKTVIFSFCRPP